MDDHIKVTNESGNFLNEEQKNVKQKMMEELLSVINSNVKQYYTIFNAQTLTDLIFSILIMFNREVLVNTITNFNIEHHRKDIMKNLFDTITYQVNNKIKDNMN